MENYNYFLPIITDNALHHFRSHWSYTSSATSQNWARPLAPSRYPTTWQRPGGMHRNKRDRDRNRDSVNRRQRQQLMASPPSLHNSHPLISTDFLQHTILMYRIIIHSCPLIYVKQFYPAVGLYTTRSPSFFNILNIH